MEKEQEKSEKQQFLDKKKKIREKIEDIEADYEGLKAALDYLRSYGAKQIDTEYIVDEMEKDLRQIEKLKAMLTESQTHSKESMAEER